MNIKKLRNKFEAYFLGKTNPCCYSHAYNTLDAYSKSNSENDFNSFVKGYFIFKNDIIREREYLIRWYKRLKENSNSLIKRISLKMDFRKYNKLCEKLGKFEEKFFEETGISLVEAKNELDMKSKEQ